MNETPEQGSSILTAERVKEIRKLNKDAQFGYANVNNQVYFRDVSALLAERDLWQTAHEFLQQKLKQLTQDNQDLRRQLDEALRNREVVS